MVQCPECAEEYSPQGLHGHLRMSHGLSGPELQKAYEGALRGNLNVEEVEGATEEKDQRHEEGHERPDEEPPRGEERPEARDEEAQTEERGAGSPSEMMAEPPGSVGPDQDEYNRREVSRKERSPKGHDQGACYRALEQLRRARMRRRIVEETMETEEEVVEEGSKFFFGDDAQYGEVPTNDTWADLLERCQWEEEKAAEELKDVVFHAEGRPEG